MNLPEIKHLYINTQIKEHFFTRRILKTLGRRVPFTYVDPEDLLRFRMLGMKESKRVIYLTHYSGDMCKPCPGTKDYYICCNYYVINESTGCPMDCTYCILQDYLDSAVLTVYVNYTKIFSEFDVLQDRYPRRIIRIGTGELSDSLALDPITNLSEPLMNYFKDRVNVLFELKTKTNYLPDRETFYGVKNIVFSWSLNPSSVINKYEHYSATLDERLEAAVKAQQAGFKLSFHFDPIIHHKGWEKNYHHVIDRLFSVIDASGIVWISLGGLRFSPALKDIIANRYPKSLLTRGEQITGMDRKIRYFKPLRRVMFKSIYSKIRSYSDDVFIYYCMEDKKIWEQTMGVAPINSNHLDFMFADSLYTRFPVMNFTKPEFDYYQGLRIKHDPGRQALY